MKRGYNYTSKQYKYFIDNCEFSEREAEVLQLKREHLTVKEMSPILDCSERTIYRIISNINEKIKIINGSNCQ